MMPPEKWIAKLTRDFPAFVFKPWPEVGLVVAFKGTWNEWYVAASENRDDMITYHLRRGKRKTYAEFKRYARRVLFS